MGIADQFREMQKRAKDAMGHGKGKKHREGDKGMESGGMAGKAKEAMERARKSRKGKGEDEEH
jgi:hypothetical protein